MAILAVFGFIPVLNTVLGLMPVNGSNIGFHAVLAITAAWFGYASQASELVRRADKFVSGEKPRVAGESKPEQKRAS